MCIRDRILRLTYVVAWIRRSFTRALVLEVFWRVVWRVKSPCSRHWQSPVVCLIVGALSGWTLLSLQCIVQCAAVLWWWLVMTAMGRRANLPPEYVLYRGHSNSHVFLNAQSSRSYKFIAELFTASCDLIMTCYGYETCYVMWYVQFTFHA